MFTGAGRRRECSADQKAAIISKSYSGVESVYDVARRHGLTPTQLFTWRRADRRRRAQASPTGSLFVPAIVEASTGKLANAPAQHLVADEAPLIGVEIDGASMWVCRGAEVATVTAIVRALKGAK